jgi:hypothetical protein
VGGRAERRTVGLSLPLLLLMATGAGAQVAPNRSTQYLFPTDVSDARALWVNPAGLGLFPEASIGLDATVGDPGAHGRLRQFTLGFNSRGLSLGYQRDVFDAGVRGSTLRIGAGFGHKKLAGGAALALYRGGTSSSAWDLGVLYAWTPAISVGGTIQNLGEPQVRGELLPVTYVPSATVQLFQGGAALSALSRVTSAGVLGYGFGLHAQLRQGTHLPVGLSARLDTDRSLHRAGFAFGLSLGGQDLAGVVATTPGDVSRVDALSLYGVSTRRFVSSGRPPRMP